MVAESRPALFLIALIDLPEIFHGFGPLPAVVRVEGQSATHSSPTAAQPWRRWRATTRRATLPTPITASPRAAPGPATPQLTLGLDDAPVAPAPAAKANGDAYVRLKALLAQRGSLSDGEVQAALGIDGEAAQALLQRLVEEGVAVVVGQKRGTRYVWRR